jgi:hypothetical protein
MTGEIFCICMMLIGLLQMFPGGSPIVAAGAFISAALIYCFTIRRSRRAIDRARLASIEAQYAADMQLLQRGHEFNEEEREIFRERAHDIGILRQRCGYIPKPDSLCAIDYKFGLRDGRL